jgi:hypothetical protein
MTRWEQVEIPNLKYSGTALFFLGVSYRLMRWAIAAIDEPDAPPSTTIDTSSVLPGGRPLIMNGLQSATKSAQRVPSPFDNAIAERTSTSPWAANDPEAPLAPGDPKLFPQAMLDAMNPEQRARVEASLRQQRAARSRG